MAGYNQESKKITALKTKVSGLYDNNTPVSDLATTLQSIGEDATVWAVQGMFFRLNYDYLGRYFSLLCLLVGDCRKKSFLNLHATFLIM